MTRQSLNLPLNFTHFQGTTLFPLVALVLLTFSVTGAKHDLVAQIIYSKPLWIIMNNNETVLHTDVLCFTCHLLNHMPCSISYSTHSALLRLVAGVRGALVQGVQWALFKMV